MNGVLESIMFGIVIGLQLVIIMILGEIKEKN